MSASSRIYTIEGKDTVGEDTEHTNLIQYKPPEDLDVKELLITDHVKSGKERYKIILEDERNDLISILEETDKVDLIQEAEIAYLSQENMLGPGIREEYVFLSEDDLQEINNAIQLQVFLGDIELAQHEPPEEPINHNAIEEPEISINIFSDRLEPDKRDICSEFLEDEELDYIEETLEHYRESIRPELYKRDNKEVV